MQLPVVSDGPIFSLAREKIGAKRALGTRLVHAASDFRQTLSFWMSFHSVVTLRISDCAPPDMGVSNLQLVAVEQLSSIEGAVEIRMVVTFLRSNGFPYEGKLSP